MIISIRGGSGSGKTTAVRQYLLQHGGYLSDEVYSFAENFPSGKHGYNIKVYKTANGVIIPGSYNLDPDTPGGGGTMGGDHCFPRSGGTKGGEMALVPHTMEWLVSLQSQGPVLVESLKDVGRGIWTRMASEGNRLIWATLDTPPDECIRRIYERREQTGRRLGTPLNED